MDTAEERLQKLREKRAKLEPKLIEARQEFLAARARRNNVLGQIRKIDKELDLLVQGQLMFGDQGGPHE